MQTPVRGDAIRKIGSKAEGALYSIRSLEGASYIPEGALLLPEGYYYFKKAHFYTFGSPSETVGSHPLTRVLHRLATRALAISQAPAASKCSLGSHLIAMELPDAPAVPLPATDAEWVATTDDQLDVLHTAWTSDVLVDIVDSELVKAVPELHKTQLGGRAHVPLHIITYFYGRVCYASPASRIFEFDVAIAPRALARVEAHVYGAAPSIFAPTTATRFVQRLERFTVSIVQPALWLCWNFPPVIFPK